MLMRAFLRRHCLLILILTTAAALTYLFGILSAIALLAVVFAVHEHHLRFRMAASFRNLRRCLALETQRNDNIQEYLNGILAAARGDSNGTPRILHRCQRHPLRRPPPTTIMVSTVTPRFRSPAGWGSRSREWLTISS